MPGNAFAAAQNNHPTDQGDVLVTHHYEGSWKKEDSEAKERKKQKQKQNPPKANTSRISRWYNSRLTITIILQPLDIGKTWLGRQIHRYQFFPYVTSVCLLVYLCINVPSSLSHKPPILLFFPSLSSLLLFSLLLSWFHLCIYSFNINNRIL